MGSRSRDVPDDELFMSRPRPAEDCDSPTVEPLRIFKPQSPPGDKNSNRPRYPAPPSSSSPAGSSSSPASKPAIAALPPLPSFPFGASSSAAPLPYPDDAQKAQPKPKPQPSRLPYPDDGPRTSSPAGRVYSPPPVSMGVPPPQASAARPTVNTGEKKTGLAERRGTAPKPLQSPISLSGDDEDGLDSGGLFAKPLRNPATTAAAAAAAASSAPKISNAYQQKPYYPPPGGAAAAPGQAPINRISSTASNSTTRASRGSPPPPETPIVEPGMFPGGIEARYAAAGISGTATLNSLQAPSAAAQSRLAQYGNLQPTAQPQPQAQAQAQPPRPWTPTETPGQQPFGPPTVYQGSDVVSTPTPPQPTPAFNLPQNPNPPTQAPAGSSLQVSVLEQDFQRMQASTPPPAYTSVNPNSGSQYPNEKQRPAQANSAAANAAPAAATAAAVAIPAAANGANGYGPGPTAVVSPTPQKQHPAATTSAAAAAAAAATTAAAAAAAAAATTAAAAIPAHNAGHPAFANDTKAAATLSPQQPTLTHTPSLLAAAQSPPPLPEGWIAHLDQNSGQYYYIHLATQATQWEFPKGPTPLNHDPAPLSPTASTYGNPLASPLLGGGKAGLASPMFNQAHPGYAESIMSVSASVAPSTAGFTGPPPSAGVDVYKVMPTNGVYFGPYLRYVNMDMERGIWLGSIMLVTDAPQPPTIHMHLSVDLSPNPRQLVPQNIHTHQRWTFYKYDVDLQMSDHGTERWTYAVTSHLGCTRYEFVVAGRYETGWRMIAHSGNDFAPSTNQNERAKLGGVGFMWKDILQKNVECGGFHVQLGLGAQIYGDRLWKEVPLLRQWLAMPGRENRKSSPWTARHQEEVSHAYFHYYTSHFDQPFMREAFAQIPHVLQVDDHDM